MKNIRVGIFISMTFSLMHAAFVCNIPLILTSTKSFSVSHRIPYVMLMALLLLYLDKCLHLYCTAKEGREV